MRVLTSLWSRFAWEWLLVLTNAVEARLKAKDRRLNMSIFLWNGLAADFYSP
jgi:hypothetical protein